MRSRCTILSLLLILAAGPGTNYAMSLLVNPHERDFNATRTEAAALISFRLTFEFIAIGVVAVVFHRLPIRVWTAIALVFACAGRILDSYDNAFWQVQWTFGFVVAAGNGILYSVAQFAVPLFFPDRVSW